MNWFDSLVDTINSAVGRIADPLAKFVWETGISYGDEVIPWVVIMLLGTGVFLTLRLGFIQIRRLGHGLAVTTGRYDDPNEPGDVSHFQALTTALSATVGIGNIAGVAIAIHWGGPGALFWMWVTAALGMAIKFTEVTLAQKYREVSTDYDPERWEGSVSGGPMYYIDRGLGSRWKWMAVLFAVLLGITAFLTGNAVQANTVADTFQTEFGISPWITGLVTASVVGAVIIGGITRIGRVTSILAPVMAAVYVAGAMFIILANIVDVPATFGLIFREAFNPSAGVAGTGVGAFLLTLMWGVRRGLFSNESGQGSAPIAHAAAKTDEPVSEGVVALLEPFIDTILICTMTGLVVIMTGAWNARVTTELALTSGDLSWVAEQEDGRIRRDFAAPAEFRVVDGVPERLDPESPTIAWHEVAVERFYADPALTQPFTGVVQGTRGVAVGEDGREYPSLWGEAVESGAPLTTLGFSRGLPGEWGGWIVMISVLLFAISTAIAWSYYGDRCAYYLFGAKALLPYKVAFIGMHFVGAIAPLAAIWTLGDAFLGVVKRESDSYFEREPWHENEEVHRRVVEEKRGRRGRK